MHKTSGNALFLILIAVALFAALAYAVTQSGRGSGSIGREQAVIYAAQITQQAASIRQGYWRMRLSGTPADEIITGDPTNACEVGAGTDNTHANFCTTGVNCLFAPEGGGVQIPQMPQAAFRETGFSFYPNYFTGANGHNGILLDGLCPLASGPGNNRQGVGTAANDDLIQINSLKEEVCAAINRGLGIEGIPVEDSVEDTGMQDACVEYTFDGGGYVYYSVVIEN